ncbi:MAG: molybdopterin converting factor subunit 1 [Hyphomicrobiaceae bacterium]|nr:molybdopterin converting factor subunit 1 [Hyphomicrobiaceae bacterium]MCC0023275.1 molybdopterin converting factor subunit 1 [Hyphomicrobiaceae bacterium]
MKILYFAWLRERLNRGEETIDPPADIATVSDLMDWLAASDEGIDLVFENRDLIRVAVDDELVEHDETIAGAETVAFFPPMTGG